MNVFGNLATTHKQLKKDRRYGKAPIEEGVFITYIEDNDSVAMDDYDPDTQGMIVTRELCGLFSTIEVDEFGKRHFRYFLETSKGTFYLE